MSFYKTVRKTIKVAGSNRARSIDLRAEIFTYDRNVSKFIFQLANDEQKIDLENAKVRVVLTYVDSSGKKGVLEDSGGVEKQSDDEIYYVLSDKLRGHVGIVVMGVYVDCSTGEAIDIQNVQFEMKRSLIDSDVENAAEIYFKSCDDCLHYW